MRTTSFVDGRVVDTNDPQQMGRVKVWCPAIDGEYKGPETLPWATYVSPLAGHAEDFAGGSQGAISPGPHAYGFWAVPKVDALVVIGFLYGDYNQRFYLGSYFPEHGNRSLPAGRNSAAGPLTDSEETVQPATANLTAQFAGQLDVSEAKTRGVYERQVAQALTDKDGKEGYQAGVSGSAATLDPQTYCISTPGRHSIIMQDNPTTGRVRIKTAEGHQVIFDDANERIYVSTAEGKSWFEMDQDGHVHVYGAESISVTSGGSINMTAKKNFNVSAGGNINLSATGHVRASACKDVSLSGDGGVNITSGAVFNILASGNLMQTGANIHLNGDAAETAPCADKTEIVPQHEPWNRPATTGTRGPNWKA